MKQAWIIPAALLLTGVSAMPALAQLSRGTGPVDVSADNLDIQREKHQAVYIGHVDVTQDDARLQANKVLIKYSAQSMQDIRTITATGNVFYTTPKEVVRGDKAVYTRQTDTIKMTGNVVLTQGKNVISADALVLNVKTGDAQFIAGEKGRFSKQRVRSVFFPEEQAKPDETQPAAETPAAAQPDSAQPDSGQSAPSQ